MPKDREVIWGTLRYEFFSFFKKNMNREEIWVDALSTFENGVEKELNTGLNVDARFACGAADCCSWCRRIETI